MNKLKYILSAIASFLLIGGIVYSASVFSIFQGGTGSSTFPRNVLVGVNSAGTALIATGTPQLTIGNLVATSTASSSFVGSVGIGTTNPTTKLSVTASAGADSLLLTDATNYTFGIGSGGFGLINIGGKTGNALALMTDNTEKVRITSTGNVGVGTTSPWAQLSVNPNNIGSGVPEFAIGSSSATHLIVTGAGNVGIGTTSPTAKLNVADSGTNSDIRVLDTNGNISGYAFGALNPRWVLGNTAINSSVNGLALGRDASSINTTGAGIGYGANSNLLFYTANGASLTERMRIDGSGNVGIGTTSPYAKLSVNPNNIGSGVPEFVVGSTSATHLVVDGGGNVGIGTTNPSQALQVNGNAIIGTSISGSSYSVAPLALVNSQSSTLKTQLNLVNIAGGVGTGSAIDFYTYTIAGNTSPEARFGALDDGNYSDHITFSTKDPGNTGNNSLLERLRITSAGQVGVSSSTPYYGLTVASTTGPQIALSAGGGFAQWTMRNAGGDFFLATSTVAGTATTTKAALSITNGGAISISTSTAGCLQTNTSGLLYSGTCAGGSGVTSVGLSLPTGFAITNSPVTTTGTLTGTLQSGYSLKKLPSYIVASAGGDFTTIQAALTQCGTDGGGNIYLTDASYAQAGTGLTWRGSNCNIYGRDATTTITFTGATTLFKTNSAVGQYSNNGLHNIVITADGNTSGVAIDWSDMSHGLVENVVADNVGRVIRLNDTQDITFYNTFQHINATTITNIGIDASSTNPTNSNKFDDIFLGSSANGIIGFQLNNGNGNQINLLRVEPGSSTGTVGVKLFDNTMTNNDGVFQNTFTDSYIEANGTGISIAASVGDGGGIQRNLFSGGMVEANTADITCAAACQSKNSFLNITDSNFTNPVQSFRSPFGLNTLTQRSIFNIFTPSFGSPALQIYNNNDFAENATNYIEFGLTNAGDSANLLSLQNSGTGNTIIATSSKTGAGFVLDSFSKMGIGTTTFNAVPGKLVIATTTTSQITLQGASGQIPWNVRSVGGNLYFATSSATSQATSSSASFGILSSGAITLGNYADCNGTSFALGITTKVLTCDTLVSDQRLKKDITPTNEGLNVVMAVQPKSWYFIDNNLPGLATGDTNIQYGIVAQDLQKIAPELVTKTTSSYLTPDGTLTYNRDAIITVLWNSIRELAQAKGLTPVKRSMEENWQDILIGLLIVGFIYQQMQIRKLKK